jgi:hypothetical protein
VDPFEPPTVVERYGRLRDMDRSFDIHYWQQQGPEAIFEAAWRMVEEYLVSHGRQDELRLQRSVENYQRQKR